MDDNLADPKLTHVANEWKYSSPLIACRFDPMSRFVFSSAQDNSVQRWNLENDEPVAVVSMRDILGFIVSLYPDHVLKLADNPDQTISQDREGA